MKFIAQGISIAALLGATAVMAHNHGAAKSGADSNGTVTRTEMQTHAAAMFDGMDANKDGKLDPADREAHMTAMFDRIDNNRDGAISREEFMAHHRPATAGQGKDTGEGHRMGHGGRHRMGHDMGKHMARMADANKDGAVSRDEFMAAANQRFDRADANKDGQVTREERRASYQAMRQHRHEMMQAHHGDKKD